MTDPLMAWAIRHCVTPSALEELRELMGRPSHPVTPGAVIASSESDVQAQIRLAAPAYGLTLWRNNVGALRDERGVPVRYGLANETAALNKSLKSGDLIGWRPVRITPEHVGAQLAQFVSYECKRPDWRFTGTAHEVAQENWIRKVLAAGGVAKFTTGEL